MAHAVQTKSFWVDSHKEVNGVKIGMAEKLVFDYLHAFHYREVDSIHPSMETIAAYKAISVPTVNKALKTLVDAKLIRKTRRANKANEYEIIVEEVAKLEASHEQNIAAAQEVRTAKVDKFRAAQRAHSKLKDGLYSALSFSKECVDRVIEILRSMGTPMNKEIFPSETPQEAPRASRLMAPSATKTAPSSPAAKKREDEWDGGDEDDFKGWGHCPATGKWLPLEKHQPAPVKNLQEEEEW